MPPPLIPGDPPGQVPEPGDGWRAPIALSSLPAGGNRPQVAVDPAGGVHVVYYIHKGATDVVVYRHAPPGSGFGPETPMSQQEGRNWGPDLVIGPDGMPWVCFDHARDDGSSAVFMTRRTPTGWDRPFQVSEAQGVETSSSHLAFGGDGSLTVVWLQKRPGAGEGPLLSRTRRADGAWDPIQPLYQDERPAWHSNIMRGPTGWQAVGFDLTLRPDFRQVQARVGLNGRWSPMQAIGGSTLGSERPNFGFDPDGTVHAVWTDSYRMDTIGVSHVTGRLTADGVAWGAPERLTRGITGRHFDPDVAGSSSGGLMAVWAWLHEGRSTLLYARRQNGRFDPPRRMQEIPDRAGLPSIYADPAGRFHVVWNQGRPENMTVYYTVSEP